MFLVRWKITMLSIKSRKAVFRYLSLPSSFRLTPINWNTSGLTLIPRNGKMLRSFYLILVASFLLLELHTCFQFRHLETATDKITHGCGFKVAEPKCEKFYANVGWLLVYTNNILWDIGVLLKNLLYKTEIAAYLNELPMLYESLQHYIKMKSTKSKLIFLLLIDLLLQNE